MDIKKLNIPTLTGPNWGSYELHIQLSSHILDIWDAICANRKNTTPVTYDILLKLTAQTHTNDDKREAATTVWLKKNLMAISLLQGMISPALWPDIVELITAKEIWDALEVRFGKVGGAQTYLQLVNMITIKMTDLDSLLTQIQEFQENYTRILTNCHSTFSEDLVTFIFCSTLPSSYEETAHQYLDNINDITKYKLLDIVAQVLQEENRQKANSIAGGSSLNKFSTVKNLNQKCAKCGKMNHSTQNHWEKGKRPQKGKGKYIPKVSNSSNKWLGL